MQRARPWGTGPAPGPAARARGSWAGGATPSSSHPALGLAGGRTLVPHLPGASSAPGTYFWGLRQWAVTEIICLSWNGSTFPLGKSQPATSCQLVPRAPQQQHGPPRLGPRGGEAQQPFPAPQDARPHLASGGLEAANAVVSSSFCCPDKAHSSGSLGVTASPD